MGSVAGMSCKLKYKAGGQSGGGSFADLTVARDVKLSAEMGEGDANSRGSTFEAKLPTLEALVVDFDMLHVPADTGYVAIRTAFLTRATVGLKILDADTGQGMVGDFAIFKFERNEPLDGAVTVSVTAKPTYSATPPSAVEAS